jgi:hypothetical protein
MAWVASAINLGGFPSALRGLALRRTLTHFDGLASVSAAWACGGQGATDIAILLALGTVSWAAEPIWYHARR